MFCPNCGQELAGSPQYCGNCGVRLVQGVGIQPGIVTAIAVDYAGFWRRFAAALIDGILISFVTTAISYFVGLIMGIVFGSLFYDEPEAIGMFVVFMIIIVLFNVGLPLLYYVLMESSSKQATLGKMALGIIVTDSEGRRISFARALGRYFAKIISAVILYIGFLMIAFTDKKQGLHDMMANCLVILK